jgi:hypothetical protein
MFHLPKTGYWLEPPVHHVEARRKRIFTGYRFRPRSKHNSNKIQKYTLSINFRILIEYFNPSEYGTTRKKLKVLSHQIRST